MTPSTSGPIDAPRRDPLWLVLLGLCYALLWFVEYGATALGQSPALDNRQTLLLARQMAFGELPPEPFHRAPLYPWLLSCGFRLGLPGELMPLFARLLNLGAFAATTYATALAAFRIWRRRSALWIAGIAVGLNPVLAFFAGDAFDILLATAAFALALAELPRWLDERSLRGTLVIGFWLALGAALRSHLLPLALLWAVAAPCLAPRARGAHCLAAGGLTILSFLLLGFANLRVAGEFRMFPWQGAYNLWAGNHPEASGRIYAQRIRVEFGESYDNPAKLESIALYESETGAEAPHSVAEMNAYWKERFWEQVREHPLPWLGLMARKAYFFLNSYEQYDNKTYGFHKPRYLALRWNPLHWGLLLLLAVAGTLAGLRQSPYRPFLFLAIGTFAVYAAGTILFYTSNRFRLPVLPLLAVLGGAVVLLPAAWREARLRWRLSLAGCLGLTATIAYSGFFDARKTDTWEEDYALLANASLRSGRETEAIGWANRVIEQNPGRSDMWAVLAQAHFNRWALDNPSPTLDRRQAEALLAISRRASASEPDFHTVSGIYLWKLGRQDEAAELWTERSARDPLARLCLMWTGRQAPPDPDELESYAGQEHYGLLEIAVEARRFPGRYPQVTETFDRLFKTVSP